MSNQYDTYIKVIKKKVIFGLNLLANMCICNPLTKFNLYSPFHHFGKFPIEIHLFLKILKSSLQKNVMKYFSLFNKLLGHLLI